MGAKTSRRAIEREVVGFATDSSLEGSGFEPSVPLGDRNKIAAAGRPPRVMVPAKLGEGVIAILPGSLWLTITSSR
jgi:hypothetical protein